MPWQPLIFISVLVIIIGQSLSKKLVDTLHPYQILVYQYFASIITIFLYHSYIYPDEKIVLSASPFLIIGILYAIGVSAYYRAVKYSLSKSALAYSFSDLITILLAVIFLGELALLNPFTLKGRKILIGLILAGISIWLIKWKIKRGKKEGTDKDWFRWISIAVLVMGFAVFLAKHFVAKTNPLEGLFFQYLSSFGAIAVFTFKEKKKVILERRQILLCLLVGIFFSTSLATFYLALSKAPITLVMPTWVASQLLLIVGVGLIVFKEKEQMSKREWVGLLTGFVAVLLLTL